MKRAIAVLECVCLSVLICDSNARGQTYKAVDLYTLGFNGIANVDPTAPGYAMNGQMAGSLDRFGADRAAVWEAPVGNVVQLTPVPNALGCCFFVSYAAATDGVFQVGEARVSYFNPLNPSVDSTEHAMLWNAAAGSVIDLNPTVLDGGFLYSQANGVGGGQQVGSGTSPATNSNHALLWTGAAESAVDLHPTFLDPGYDSIAYNTDGAHQVGAAGSHAMLWSGTADSAIDLHPTNLGSFVSSEAYSVRGTQQVGYGYVEDFEDLSEKTHALMWSSTADSAVDLNPVGFADSKALGTNGVNQAGFGVDSIGRAHAMLWTGNSQSAIDLGKLLPVSLRNSWADAINAQGIVFGVAYDTSKNVHAVEWVPIPEPSGLLLAVLGVVLSFSARRAFCLSLLPNQ